MKWSPEEFCFLFLQENAINRETQQGPAQSNFYCLVTKLAQHTLKLENKKTLRLYS